MTLRSPIALFVLVAVFSMSLPSSARAVAPTAGEMAESLRWASAMFEGVAASTTLEPGLEVVTNFDPVQKNARFGKPLKLAAGRYTHGLFCHANSKIIVRLPSPGNTFEAIAGVDSNDQTVGGRGSVVFRRASWREGRVPLAGATGGNAGSARQGRPGGRPGVYAGGERLRQWIQLRPGRLGRRQDHVGRRQDRLARRSADGRRSGGGRSEPSAVFVRLRWPAFVQVPERLEAGAGVEAARSAAHRANPYLHRSQDRAHRPRRGH